jgi:hypothetical protein
MSSSPATAAEQEQQNGSKITTTVSADLLVLSVPRRVYDLNEPWFVSRLRDDLFECLSTAARYELTYDPAGFNGLEIKHPQLKNFIEQQYIQFHYKYHEEAARLMGRMAVYKGKPPTFVIHISDLPQKVKQELFDLKVRDPQQYNRVVSEAIDRLCEHTNYELFHRSAYNYPKKWRFEE